MVGRGNSACVRVLFALLGWTCLYLFKEPGDTGCLESSTCTQGCARGEHIPPSGQDATSLPNTAGSRIVGSPPYEGAPVGPSAGVEVLSLPCTAPAALSHRGDTFTRPRPVPLPGALHHRDCPQRPMTARPPPACVSGGFNCSGVS